MSLIDFYKTQARVLWEWRGGPWALFKRLVITLFVSTISLLITAWIMPGVEIGTFRNAAVAVILMVLFVTWIIAAVRRRWGRSGTPVPA